MLCFDEFSVSMNLEAFLLQFYEIVVLWWQIVQLSK